MRALVLYCLLIVSTFGANVTDIICPDEQNNDGIFELTLQINGDLNASFEQKDEGSVTILIFKELKIDKPFNKKLNTEVIKSVNIKPDTNATKISFEGKQLFDISVSSAPNRLHIAVIPKAAPLMIEDIAKDTAGGQIGYILETLLFIALILLILTALAVLFLKFKLSSRIQNIQEEDEKPLEESILNEEPAMPQKHPKVSKKSSGKRQKTLFDI
ncbi:MAG: hypothetical protein LBL65_03310 [Campylobacteraceae bacterium]|nr:hypothetical protein [Campylobacteraceae bacterium]